ncbi:hypothetical protein BDA99DRAFT_544198 [Phascolomyces articulosus]|uniref:Pentatricopeptide repeat-containing protein-mitochondrial domain-containing protein n=1 Tax=Phascolomyces articulosus TaxID=60185 RepID=A0AAD5JKR9_9FUNG|nr:hypothetical protein BDA99DRAFT_544198 [Phascolomyces articulosus]
MQESLDISSAINRSGEQTLEIIVGLARRLDKANISYNTTTYEHLLSAYSKLGHTDQIMPLLADMYRKDIRPSANFFHNALKLASRFADARLQALVLEEMKKSGHDIKSPGVYSYLFRCMRNNGEIERMIDTLEEMRKENITPPLYIYRQFVSLCLEFKEPDIAYNLLKEAAALDSFAAHHQHLYMDLLRCGALMGSHMIVKDMWKVAVLDHGIKPDEGLCHYVLHVAAKYGNSELGSDVIRIIGKLGYPYKESHFAPLVEAFAATGDWKSTLHVLHLIRKAGVIPTQETSRSIVYKLGNDVDAIRIARKALDDLKQDSAVDILAFNLIIHAFAHNNQYADAMETFSKATEMKIKINIETIHAVLDACIHAKEVNVGIKVFNQFVNTDISSGDHQEDIVMNPNPTTMSKMVTLMCTQDDYEDAFKYLELMKSMGFVPLRGCYYRLVKKLASHQDPRLNIALEEMKACGYQLNAFLQGHIDKHTPSEELYNRKYTP